MMLTIHLLVLNTGTPLKTAGRSQQDELMSYINALQDKTANVRTLQKLMLICNSNPAVESDDYLDSPHEQSPPQSHSSCTDHDIWDGGKLFDSLSTSLLAFLGSSTVGDTLFSQRLVAYQASKDEEILEYGLCVIWEMVEHQAIFVDETEILSFLFIVRYTNTCNVSFECPAQCCTSGL
jgi:CLIP-associating protein 1/2